MPRNPAPKKTTSPAADQPGPVEQEPSAAAAVATIDRPKPKPPKKKAAPPKPSDLLAGEIDQEKRLAVAREELVFRRHELLGNGQDLSPGEFRLLQIAVPSSPHQNDFDRKEEFRRFLEREERRVQTIINLQTAAGTPVDRATADKLAETTQRKLDSDGPGIDEQIRKLRDELGALYQSATDAKSAADARHAADASLRDQERLPAYVRDELAALHHGHETDFGTELRGLETRRIQIESLLILDAKSRYQFDLVDGGDVDLAAEAKTAEIGIKHHVEGVRRFGGDPMERLQTVYAFTTERVPGGVSYRFGKIRADVWNGYVDSLRVELGDVENRIESIANGGQAAADKETEELKSFYCLK